MGQSGSGKSTLMNVLGCLDNPSSGQFLIDGSGRQRLWARRAGPGCGASALASSSSANYQCCRTSMRAATRLSAPRSMPARSTPRRQQRAGKPAHALRAAGAHAPPAQRASWRPAAAAFHRPRATWNGGQIIPADEPTGALRLWLPRRAAGPAQGAERAGHTIILVTHDAHVAAHARRVIELRDGHIVRDGGTPDGYTPPWKTAAPRNRGGWRSRKRGQWREALAWPGRALRQPAAHPASSARYQHRHRSRGQHHGASPRPRASSIEKDVAASRRAASSLAATPTCRRACAAPALPAPP